VGLSVCPAKRKQLELIDILSMAGALLAWTLRSKGQGHRVNTCKCVYSLWQDWHGSAFDMTAHFSSDDGVASESWLQMVNRERMKATFFGWSR